jgi:hypothetical protein
MNAIHHYGILHNNLSKNNIMLHFPTNKSNVVYIGLCDWGEIGHMQKVTLCLYVPKYHQHKENVLMGGSINIFYSWRVKNPKFLSSNGQTTLNNFEV